MFEAGFDTMSATIPVVIAIQLFWGDEVLDDLNWMDTYKRIGSCSHV